MEPELDDDDGGGGEWMRAWFLTHDFSDDMADDPSIPADDGVVIITARGLLDVLPDQCARHLKIAIPLSIADMGAIRRIAKPGATIQQIDPHMVPALWMRPKNKKIVRPKKE